MTGENVPIAVLEKCEKYALFSVIGRSSYSDRADDEYLSNLEKIRQIKGGCLYERGFVFKVKLFSVYCSKLEEVCKAYSKYRN
nr:hypothetical protein [uncultured Haemophilus sp.]